MNKQGGTLGGWMEAVVFSGAFMLLILLLFGAMNSIYEKDYDASFGLDGGGAITDAISLQESLETGVGAGEADFDSASGLQISTMWALMKASWSTAGTFITGGWIEKIVSNIGLPLIIGRSLRVLFLISLTFILVALLLRVKKI